MEECDETVPLVKNQNGYVKNIKPSASGPSASRVRAQSTSSVPPSTSLPALSVPEVDPYDAETDIESDVHVETIQEGAFKSTGSPSKKGSISITSHTLKKTTTAQKYKCKICDEKLDSVRELMNHHQTNHHILYCSMCSKAFNNPLSLLRHEYEHKHHVHKCPNVTVPLLLKVRLRPICFHIARSQASFVYTLDVAVHSTMKVI